MLPRLFSKWQLFAHVYQNRRGLRTACPSCPCSYSVGPTEVMTLNSHIFPARRGRASTYLPVRHHEFERLGYRRVVPSRTHPISTDPRQKNQA
jgi:hypothetical protein